MAGGFSEQQREEIHSALIQAGIDIGCGSGLKKMTVAMVAGRAGVAVGSFYNFFSSKEEFVTAMIRSTEESFEKDMAACFSKDGTVGLKKFLDAFRLNFDPSRNFLLRLDLEDWVWMKTHITDRSYFDHSGDLMKISYLMPKIKGIRKDADLKVVANFIKSIYAMYQNRDTLFEDSLQTNVDLIFDSIYRYLKA